MCLRWRCTDASCKKSVSAREGSFSAKSRLTLQQWLLLLYWWIREYPVRDAAEEAKVNKDTAGAVYQRLWEVCSTKLLNSRIELGGPGTIVQMDEFIFRHKPKVGNKEKDTLKTQWYPILLVLFFPPQSAIEGALPAGRYGFLGW